MRKGRPVNSSCGWKRWFGAAAAVLVLMTSGAYAESLVRNPGAKPYPKGLASSMQGEIGLLRGASAVIMPRNTFSILAAMDYWKMQNFFAQGLEQSRLDNMVGFSMALVEYWEIYLAGNASSHLLEDNLLGDRVLAQAIGDFAFGSKWSMRAQPWLWLGLDFTAKFRTKRGGIGPNLKATAFGPRLLATFDWTGSDTPRPVRLNLNFGYMQDYGYRLLEAGNETDPIVRYALGVPYDDQYFVGTLSLEIPQEWINIFFEYSTEQFQDFNDNLPDFIPERQWRTNVQRISPGIRVFPVAGMHIDFGVELGHNLFMKRARFDIQGFGQSGTRFKVEPDWSIHSGVGYVFLPPKPELPKEGRVWGLILDGRDRTPIAGAQVSFPGANLTTLLTGPDGKYRSYQFNEGVIKIRVDAPNFTSVETAVTIKPGQEERFDFVLEYAEEVGELIGQITDNKGNGLPGTLEFTDAEVAPISADAQSGQFQVSLKPAIYTLKASAPGYDPQLKRVRIVNQRRTVVNFVLQPSRLVGTLRGTVKDVNGAPLPAVLQFNVPSVNAINVDPASGEYSGEVPPGTYTVRAFAPGYQAQERSVKIVQDGVTVLDFVLEEAATTGKIVGVVRDAKTKGGIYGVISFPNGEQGNVPTDPETGSFVLEVPAGTYQIKAANPSYKSTLLNVRVEKGQETRVTFELQPYDKVRVTADEVEITDRIEFTSGKATIKVESYPILDEIAQILKEVPDMKLIVEGHTDSVGDDTLNKRLSQRRAEAVRDYLISRGIRADRLQAIGFGEERPIADNTSEAGRAENRRVEFKIVK